MNTLLKSAIRSTVIGLGLLGAGIASADSDHRYNDQWSRNQWSNSRWNREPVRVVRVPVVHYDYARVVDVDPIVRRVAIGSPQRDCWYEDREVAVQRSATPAVLGAIIGGVIGHQIGSGHTRGVATAAGAILGASVGSDAAARDSRIETRSVERCESRYQRDWEERIDGYHVTYRYEGREYNTVMGYDPGNRVQVRVGRDVAVVR